MHAQLWPLDWWAIVLPECWNIVQKYFFLYMLLANLITLFLLIYHLFNRSDYGLLKKKIVLGKVENWCKAKWAWNRLQSRLLSGWCLVLENSDSSPGCNVMLLCSVKASAFCLNDLITHVHREPKMKTLILLICLSSW